MTDEGKTSYYYWDRGFINERLRLALHQSYRLIPATPSGRIRSDSVLLLLNRSRIGIDEPVSRIPSDLLTPDETVARFSESGVTIRDLHRWMRRTRNVVPHFRINHLTVRFSASMLDRWLAENSKTKGVSVA